MAAPGNGERSLREQAERLALVAVGAVALTRERIDELGEELARRAGMRREDAVELVQDVVDGWRREAGRIGDRTTEAASRVVHELGLVTRDELEDLELRLAQLEHRLGLVERAPVD